MGRRGFQTDDFDERDVDLSGGLGGLVPAEAPEPEGDPEDVADVLPDEGGTPDPEPEEEPGGDDAVEDGDQDAEPDYGPGRDTIYRRETWPAYAYPKRKKIRIPMAALWAIAGVAAGLILSATIFLGIRAIQERMMYQDVEQVIRAQWPNMQLTIRPGFHDDLVNAPYYESDAWNALDPVENEDGSITFEPGTSREFCDLILEMRAYMDSLIEEYTDDEAFIAFGTASPSLDYDIITATTPMHQSGLIDQDRVVTLLRQMKIHNIFYRAISGEEPEVRLVFMNGSETVLIMRM